MLKSVNLFTFFLLQKNHYYSQGKAALMATVRSVLTHKLLKIIIALYLSLYFFIWAISSPVTKYYLQPVLNEYGLIMSKNTSIRYNPFITELHISDLSLHQQSNNEKVFAISGLTIQLRLWEVIFDEVVIEEFVLTDGYIKVINNQGELTVAGVSLPKSDNTESKKSAEDAPNEPLPYQVNVPELLISQFHIDIINNDIPHDITINTFALRDIKATQFDQEGKITLDALLDKTKLSLQADANLANALGDITSEVKLSNYPIEKVQRYIKQVSNLKGELSLQSKQKLTLKKQGVALHIDQATIENNNLFVSLVEQNISLDNVKHTITDLVLTLTNGHITEFDGISSVLLSNFKVTNTEQEHVFSSEKLAIDNMVFHHDSHPSVNIADIVIDKLAFSSKDETSELVEGEKLPSVMKLNQVTISDIKANEHNLSIDTITLDELLSHIIINENKDIVNLVNLSKKASTEEAANTEKTMETETLTPESIPPEAIPPEAKAPEAKKSAEPEFTFSLNKFQMINKNEIFFVDHSVEPTYNSDFFIDTLELKNINNSLEKQLEPSPYVFKARNNKYAKLNLTGFIKPFAPTPVYNMVGDFKEMSLPAITSYLKDATGLEVKTGQLNVDINVTLTGDMIDGETELLLQGLETAVYDDDEVDSLIAQGALPLNIAMGMLKDSDGNVELGFPLSGSTSDPKFGLTNIVAMISQKAILSATQDYLITTFVPYANIVSLAMTAGEFALKLRFDDLPYDAQQVSPNEKQQAYLDQFITLMQDKENTRVNICAINTPQDINLETGKKITNKADKKRLIALGKERASALKDYLIEQGKIDSSRMLLCKPKIDSSQDAKPRIAISV